MRVWSLFNPKGIISMIAVHHYKVLDAITGLWRVPLIKCSEERIAELGGQIIGRTMQTVARNSLTPEGCYEQPNSIEITR